MESLGRALYEGLHSRHLGTRRGSGANRDSVAAGPVLKWLRSTPNRDFRGIRPETKVDARLICVSLLYNGNVQAADVLNVEKNYISLDKKIFTRLKLTDARAEGPASPVSFSNFPSGRPLLVGPVRGRRRRERARFLRSSKAARLR